MNIVEFRTQTSKSLSKNIKLIGIVFVIVAVSVGMTWWVLAGSKTQAQRDLTHAKTLVARHMILPSDEEPTLALVTDKAQLKDKFLSANANNGDQVLIYTQHQIAIIYRESVDKIVAVGSVSADSALAESQGTTVTVLNGANDVTKTKKVIDQLKASYPDMTVTDGGLATRHDFTRTIVVDSTNSKDFLVEALTKLTGGAPGVVPLSEAKPETDLMIIVGADS